MLIWLRKILEAFFLNISRQDAISAGLKTYYTGKPCKNGGISERRTSDKKCLCSECKNKESESKKEYYKSRRDDLISKQKEFNSENRESIIKYKKEYRDANRMAISYYSSKYYSLNSERICMNSRQYAGKNAAKVKERISEWCRKNRYRLNASSASRKLDIQMRRIYQKEDERFFFEQELFALAYERSKATGIPWHVDHMIPLRSRFASGLHTWNNLQVIPAYLNSFKKNKMLMTENDEWLLYV